MERPNTISSETITALLEQLKTTDVEWPYRFYRGSPVFGTIEIDHGFWMENVTMGNHCIHSFSHIPGTIDEAFVRGRVDAIQALWKQDLNVLCGQFAVPPCCRLRMEFPGSEDDLGIHECGVCFEPTTIVTNCLTDGRPAPHPLCAGCIAKLDGKCPHKHDEFKGGFLGCMCCGSGDSDSEPEEME